MTLFEDDEGTFYLLMGHVAEGGEAWLDVAAALAPGADAHPGEELQEALAFALIHNPTGVLSRSFAPTTLQDICSGPGLQADEAAYRSAISNARHALASVTSARLREARDACLRTLGAALSENDAR